VCRDLDLAEIVVRRWLAQVDIDAGRREGLTTAEREELTKLRRENRVSREERDILKSSGLLCTRDDEVSRFRFIAAEKATSSVVRLRRALEVSSSGFYAWQRRQTFGHPLQRDGHPHSVPLVGPASLATTRTGNGRPHCQQERDCASEQNQGGEPVRWRPAPDRARYAAYRRTLAHSGKIGSPVWSFDQCSAELTRLG
jgi:hypothetical protein